MAADGPRAGPPPSLPPASCARPFGCASSWRRRRVPGRALRATHPLENLPPAPCPRESGPGLWQLHRLLSALTPRRGGRLACSSIWLRGRECSGPPRVTRPIYDPRLAQLQSYHA
ncbi:hypothetical protein NDU88_001039 [Pleurodeles waltl]|uniref:Uncharacterized protein n=1 Tax=Pleurodeles waltl TaxID=8319 RepID=A0AAV7WKM5_PLEWA|nr:hypothetical protein NDU88_001039 [Pleurodeles waltl]